jgi:hypothetical protein
MVMASHANRNSNALPAAGTVLVALLAVSSWLSGGRPAVRAQAPAGGGRPQPGGPTDYAYFEKLKKQADEAQKKADEQYRKARSAAQPHIEAQAQARGGTEQARQQVGATLAQINARLQPGAPPLPPGTPGYRVEPGMRLDVTMKDGVNKYSGALVGIKGTTVLLQTIPLPGAQPSEFDLSTIAAFQTTFGIFAYNPRTRLIVPALTYYQFNKSTGNFERMTAGTGDAFLAQDAKVVGPSNSAQALYGVAPDGTWSIGLPVPYPDSPAAIPAGNFQRIITSEGVYTYDAQAKDYTYQTHAQIAQAAQAQKDAAGQAYYKQQWDRDVQTYQLQTDRVRAMQPYFGSFWGGGPAWPWWQSRGPGPSASPGGGGTPPPP